MAGAHAGQRVWCVLAALGLLFVAVPRAQAVEAFDGRIQAHGFLEMQIRGLDRDFSEEFDLAQWYNVVNVELEFDILPDGWGPFDLLQAFVRIEGRFDCLYYDACGIFPSARTYGNKSRNLPLRLRDAENSAYVGVIEANDQAVPPGVLTLVPEDTRDPTPWVLDQLRTLPITPLTTTEADPVPKRRQEPGVDYDPLLDNQDAPNPPYANSYCPTSGLIGTAEAPIGCYTNRPEAFEIQKRRAFPGFDIPFDINGADGELGPNPDYFLADPDGTVNDLLGLPAPTTQDYERVLRGLAFERDDPAYYTLGVKVDADIIGGVDVSAIQIEGRTQEEIQQEAEEIVYGVDMPLLNPNRPALGPDKLEGVDGFAEKIRDAGRLYTLDPMLDWRFTFRDKKGPAGELGETVIMGPWLPKNFFGSLAALSDRANPFRGRKTPTQTIRTPVDVAEPRAAGVRYQILDVASGYFDPTADCDTGLCTYGPDPVDPRLLKYEQLLIAADRFHQGVPIGGHSPYGKQRVWFGPYPNKYLSDKLPGPQAPFVPSFGGDFSGIVARYNTYTTRPVAGSPLQATPFIEQIAFSQTPGYNSIATDRTIAYTNLRVTGGLGELPMRVAPDRSNLSKLDLLEAQGLYIPSRGLIDALSTQDFDEHEFNISQIDRAFNHGVSQSDTYEVKEAYVDMEFLDSRLWVRAGIQNIVWGKTELFRTTDQFNPQDLAMASLPGLEESRIALLSGRAVYSFYDIGPLEDVRLELAANFDRIKPADLGACGEPYTFDLICSLTFGLAFHSIGGVGLAGVDRPPSAWNDVKGVEFGGRIEFRWDRFSFAITDFYGYDDLPYPDPIFFYERNVDPNTGRPRKAGATGPCENAAGFQAPWLNRTPILQAGNARLEFIEGDPSAAPTGEELLNVTGDDYRRRPEPYTILGVGIDEACLKPGGAPGYPNENRYDPSKGSELDPADFPRYSSSVLEVPVPTDTYIYQTLGQWTLEGSSVDYALAYHPANQQFFAALCSMTVTIDTSLTPAACGFSIFGSPTKLVPLEGPETAPFSEFFAVLTAGEVDADVMNYSGWRLIQGNLKRGSAIGWIPTSPLNRDVRDGLVTAINPWAVRGGDPWSYANYLTLDSTLTSEQSALLGCGPFFGTRCDTGAAGKPYNAGGQLLGWDFGEGGGIDLLNMEAGAVLQSFPGIAGTEDFTPRWVQAGEDLEYDESGTFPFPDPRKNADREFVWVDTWTTWSDDPQPGTIGFEGSESCTRYAPDSPYADERGIVRLPGCRGAQSVTVNHEISQIDKPGEGTKEYPTIDVVFDSFYTPRQDGCLFSEYMRARDEDGTPNGEWYAVRAVNEDGSTDGEAARIQAELNETCFNAIWFERHPEGLGRIGNASLRSTWRFQRWWRRDGSDGIFPADPPDWRSWGYDSPVPPEPKVYAETWLGTRTLFHPLASCEKAGPDHNGEEPWLGPDDKLLCDFRNRNLEADFIEGHAQIFRNEVAAWSWNMMLFLVVTSCNSTSGGDDLRDADCFDPELAWDVTRCSLSTPQFCRNVKSFLTIGASNRNHVLAGGNDRFGRLDFIWHSGGEAVLRYARRNVFGFSMDFAEDVSKTNWGLEFTWFGNMPFVNHNSMNFISDSQTLNLTISVDRPTFINFLNANRTFFFNTQWFFQYLLNYDKGFATTTGPFNVLFTFAFFTGYFQDRLLPQMVTVFDFRSQSGGFLPSIQYRFNERFSVTFGINYFIGRGQFVPMPLRGLEPVSNRAGAHAYEDGTEFFISNFRSRDEAYLRIRWTF